jgi:hypothetical protein
MRLEKPYIILISWMVALAFFLFIHCGKSEVNHQQTSVSPFNDTIPLTEKSPKVDSLRLDTLLYTADLLHLAHNKPSNKWPVKTEYPLPGAILPFKRVVTYYGNFYSTGMGILGELPPADMLKKLQVK